MPQLEPILKENKDRFVIFPVKHHDIWDWYKEIQAGFWTAEGIDLQKNLPDWDENLTEDERKFIKHLLAYFMVSDGVAKQNLSSKFEQEVQYPEARFFYGFQNIIGNVHSETYSLLLETYTTDGSEKEQLLKAVKDFPVLQKKTAWIQKWNNSNSFAERLIAFAAVEQIFFSAAFCSIFFLKKHEILSGLTSPFELISRDKAVHCGFALHLHNNHLVNKVPKRRIREIIFDALEIQNEFIMESLQANHMGVKQEAMIQYLQFIADQLLIELECGKEFGSANPFDDGDKNEPQENNKLSEKRAGEFKKSAGINKDQDSEKLKSDNKN